MAANKQTVPRKGLARNRQLAERNATIRWMYETLGMSQQTIADEFSLTQSIVSRILRNPASEYYCD